MTAIHAVACDPKTGYVIESLPGLRVTSSLPKTIGKGGTATFELPITDRLPGRWELATEPNRVVIALHYDDAPQTPLWVGIVNQRVIGSGPTISIGCEQVEDWLGHGRYMPDRTFSNTDQATIMKAIVSDDVLGAFYGDDDTTMTGITRTRSYTSADDKTRLSAAQDLMSVINGCEFTIRWRWEAGRLLCIPTVAQRIGRPAPADGPTFVLSRTDWTRTNDYTDGKGATLVTGIATRQGDERVQVTRSDDVLIGAGYLPTEYRWQPDTGSVDESVIDGYVEQRLADIRLGTTTIAATAHVGDLIIGGPNVDLGDDIGLDLANPDLGFSLSVTARMVGWVAQPDAVSGEITKLTPVLQGGED